MTRRDRTIPADYFDALYSADPDPWGFRTSAYESEKYDATLAALSRTHYAAALEVGCAIGVFTARLATRCTSLLAVDASDVALDAARLACAALPSVRFARCMLPGEFPAGRFELIVISEVLYFLTAANLAEAAACCFDAQGPGGEIVLCHWLGETDYPLSGAQASEAFAVLALARDYDRVVLHDDGVYRLERLIRKAPPV